MRLSTCPLVAASAPPPVWSAPHAKQNLLLSGRGVWHLTQSIVVLTGGGESADGPGGGRKAS